MSISDDISKRIYLTSQRQGKILSRLRYSSDYGHGFLGLFAALFEGRLEEVIRDPGPPYIDEKDIPLITRSILQVAYETHMRNSIPKKYSNIVENLNPLHISKDSLFE